VLQLVLDLGELLEYCFVILRVDMSLTRTFMTCGADFPVSKYSTSPSPAY